MIGDMVKRYWLQLLVVALIGVLAFFVNRYRDNAITYKDQRDKATKSLRLANATIKDMQVRPGCQIHEGIVRCEKNH